jgi:hypothetical protein
MLGRIFGPDRENVTGGFITFCNESQHNLHTRFQPIKETSGAIAIDGRIKGIRAV